MYKYIISDIVGVIHDNYTLYDGVIEKLNEVKNKGIKLSFLSNNPRRSYKAEKFLNELGITRNHYHFVQTAGDLFYDNILKQETHSCEALFMGQEKDTDFADNTKVKLNYDYNSNCKYAIIMGFKKETDTMQDVDDFVATCLKNKLAVHCLNPDLCIVNKAGEITMYCAGMIANKCQKLGCKVFYYGKPYQGVYEEVLKKFNYPNKAEVLAIGDTLETDIKGANDFGIDSVFVRSGVDMHQDIILSKIKPKYAYDNILDILI